MWQNLERHNVGKDLMPGQASDIDLTYANDACLVRSQEELPRYFISANQDQFNSLFSLEQMLGEGNQETMESVWRLIGRLKTNPQLYLSLLRNENLEERLGKTEEVSSYRLLYSLQIIYSLMASYGRKRAGMVNLYLENRKPLWGTGNNLGLVGAQNGQPEYERKMGFSEFKQSGHGDYDQNFPSFEESKQ